MTKLSEAQALFTRTQGQITTAQGEIEKLDASILASDEELTNQLGKPDLEEKTISNLESGKERLEASKVRLEKRISALEKILPQQQKELAGYELASAIRRYPKGVEAVNEAIQVWEDLAKQACELKALADAIRGKRMELKAIASEIAYLTAVLGVDRVSLESAGSLKREDVELLRDAVFCARNSELDPRSTNEFDEKLKTLREERKEKERAIAIEKNRAEAEAAR